MSDVQRVIKYLAIAFALFLIASIISGIMSFFGLFGNILNNSNITEKLEGIDINGDVSVLDIEVSSVNIILKEGDELHAETNNKNIKVRKDKNKLFITQKKHNWLNDDIGELIIYIPIDLVFDGVSITSGAGKVDINQLVTRRISLELGAGSVKIGNLTVIREAEIDGGAGEMIISNGNINNLDLDLGIGKVTVTSIISGSSSVDSGVGEVSLNLIGSIDDYKLRLDKGIGSTILDGEKMNDNMYYGNGNNFIDIEGGIGKISINFIEME